MCGNGREVRRKKSLAKSDWDLAPLKPQPLSGFRLYVNRRLSDVYVRVTLSSSLSWLPLGVPLRDTSESYRLSDTNISPYLRLPTTSTRASLFLPSKVQWIER